MGRVSSRGISVIIFGPILARIYAEILIVLFKINDHLRQIQHNTDHWGGPGSLMNAPSILTPLPTTTQPAHPSYLPPHPQPTTAPGRALHHGADDNASGTTTVLELARIYAHRSANQPPARSLVFCAFTAEEMGSIGSARFVNHPPIDLKKTVAMLNLDMVGRVRNHLLYIGGGGTAEPFHALLKKADDDSPLQFKTFGEGGLGPSDHMSFAPRRCQ